jgi:hypothetical protein
MRKSSRVAAFAASAFTLAALSAIPAAADVKLAYIDPLSGGAASAGINAQKHFTYLIDKINAAGGLNGEKLQIVFYDNKVDPQESSIVTRGRCRRGGCHEKRRARLRWRSPTLSSNTTNAIQARKCSTSTTLRWTPHSPMPNATSGTSGSIRMPT